MKKELTNKEFTRVLVFNSFKRLVGVYHSIASAATSLKTSRSAIYQACDGTCISSHGSYFRFLSDDIEIDWSNDLGTLKLEDYDQLCGVTRKYWNNISMSRKGMKYKNRPKPSQK